MKKTHKSRYAGQGLVEFALALPVVLLLMFGLIEFGRILFVYSVVNTASREAARYGIATGDITGIGKRYYDCDGIRAAALTIGRFATMQDTDILISYDSGPGTAAKYVDCDTLAALNGNDSIEFGDRIVVTATVSYSSTLSVFLNIPELNIQSTSARSIVTNAKVVDEWDDPGSEGELPTESPTITNTPNPLYTATITNTPTITSTLPTATNTVPAPFIPAPFIHVTYTTSGTSCIDVDLVIEYNPSWLIDPGEDPARYQLVVQNPSTYITSLTYVGDPMTWELGLTIKNNKTASFGAMAIFPGLNTSQMATVDVKCSSGTIVVIP